MNAQITHIGRQPVGADPGRPEQERGNVQRFAVELGSNLQTLQARLQALEERLGPVLMKTPKDGRETGPQAAPAVSTHADSLRGYASHVTQMIEYVNGMIQAVDV